MKQADRTRKRDAEMPHTTGYAQVQHRGRTAGRLFALFAFLGVWLGGALPAAAQIKPASEPIVNTRIRHIAEMIPGSATDLPPYLAHPQDVYLLVTAGGAYTEVVVLANPEVPAVSVARALSSALAGTSLSGQPVEWSADRYSAAEVEASTASFGSRDGANTVPIGPLMAGLRRAGLTPHLLLRVPTYAGLASVPRSYYGTRTFRWYDASRLGSRSSVTVLAHLGPISLYRMLAYFLTPALISLLGLGLAGGLSGRSSRDNEAQRWLFRKVSGAAMTLSLLALAGANVYLILTPTPAALADLWLGRGTITPLIPFLVAGSLGLVLFALVAHRQEIRRFGPAPVVGMSAIPMSDEEKSARKRVAQWSALPHLVGTVALGAVPFFVSRTSPLYPYIHPVALFLPLFGAGLAGRILQTRLVKFTQKTLDDSLTWRARQLGQTLGVRMPDVFVEDSSRAAHLAFASHQGHHVTLSRKLVATFTPAETDFVLASHLAGMRRHTGSDRRWLRSLLPLLMVLPILAVLSPRLIPGAPTLTSFILSPWFPAAIVAHLVLSLVLLLALIGGGTKRQIKQEADTDQAALEATGDLAAALSALSKLEAPPATAAASGAGITNPRFAETSERHQQTRLVLRRTALEKTALTLRFVAAPGTRPDLNPLAPVSTPEDAPRRY